MKEQAKKVFCFFKKRVRISVIVVTLSFSMFFIILSYSYALFTITVEKKNAIGLIAGQFSYQLSGTNMINNQIMVAQESVVELPIIITSNNMIESNYQLYYEGTIPKDIKISYIEESGNPNGTIGTNSDFKQLILVIENETPQSQTITLGVQGGLVNQENILLDNRKPIDQIYSYTQTYGYTGEAQEWIVPISGYYQISLEAASGSQHGNYQPGPGGYVSGVIYLNAGEQYYFYVGDSQNAFNTIPLANTYIYASGGGATDMRMVKGTTPWDIESLKSRIMVAGGGGGAEWPGTVGGAGGRLIADNGWGTTYGPDNWDESNAQVNYNISCGGGGQTSGGTCYGYSISAPGTFGMAGWYDKWDGQAAGGSIGDNGGIGGGGYYGGGSMGYAYGGGGGSSFISGYAGVNAIDSSGIHTNNTFHYSGKYFIDGDVVAAYNIGNGKAEVSYIGLTYNRRNTKLDEVRYIKNCINSSSSINDSTAIWTELQAIKNGQNVAFNKKVTATSPAQNNRPYENLVDGKIEIDSLAGLNGSGIQCITVDLGDIYDLDEIAVWHYWDDWRVYNDHSLSVSRDNTSYTTISTKSDYAESSIGFHIDAWD